MFVTALHHHQIKARLLRLGCQITAGCNRGNVLALLERGAYVNTKGTNGDTPLHLAAASGNKDIAIILLSRGARKDLKATNGALPIDLAEREGHTELVPLLTP